MSGPNGNGPARWPRPGMPLTIVLVSVTISLVAVTALLFVLYSRTIGPGQVLREFAQRVDEGDCEGSYELLDRSVDQPSPSAWCARVPAIAEEIDPGFTVDQIVLQEDVAFVRISGPGTERGRWELSRNGRSWLVIGRVPPG